MRCAHSGSERVVLADLVASRLGYTRRAVADAAKVSPLTVRDVVGELKKYLT